MTILRCRDDAIERRQRLFVLQPRLTATAGRIDRAGILDDQSLVCASARGVEQLVDVRSVADRALIGETNRAVADDFAQSLDSLAQRQFEKRLAILVKEIEREERNRRVAEERIAHFTAAEAGLNYGEWEDAIAESDDFAIENDSAPELPRGRLDFRKAMRDIVECSR